MKLDEEWSFVQWVLEAPVVLHYNVKISCVRNRVSYRVLHEPPTASPPKWARGCRAGTRTCAAESKITLQSEGQLMRASRSVGGVVVLWSAFSGVEVYTITTTSSCKRSF